MDGGSIRTLADCRQASIPTPPGAVAITRDTVVAAGLDPEVVAPWVEARGGSVEATPGMESRGIRPGRAMARLTPPTVYYVVPVAALAP